MCIKCGVCSHEPAYSLDDAVDAVELSEIL